MAAAVLGNRQYGPLPETGRSPFAEGGFPRQAFRKSGKAFSQRSEAFIENLANAMPGAGAGGRDVPAARTSNNRSVDGHRPLTPHPSPPAQAARGPSLRGFGECT
jgi:hypothetical protein